VSEVNLGLYRTFVGPWVRAITTEPVAEAIREMHPHRLRFRVFSDRNPLMLPVKGMAAEARANRKPVSANNPFLALEKEGSELITTCLRAVGDIRDALTEATFLNIYGSPFIQAVAGLNAEPTAAPRHIEREVQRERAAAELHSALEHRFETGGADEGALRALIYVRRPDGSVDERGFRMLKIIRDSRKVNKRLTLAQFKAMLRDQYQLILLDEERAVKSLPRLLRLGEPDADAALDALRELLVAPGPLSKEEKIRLGRVEKVLGVKLVKAGTGEPT
jgi:hypothetical protein